MISLSVRFASMWLSNAFAIFLIATMSLVSVFITELQNPKTVNQPQTIQKKSTNRIDPKINQTPRSIRLAFDRAITIPYDPVGTPPDGHDRRLILGRDLEQVAEDVVLQVPPAVRHRDREIVRRSSIHLRSAGRRARGNPFRFGSGSSRLPTVFIAEGEKRGRE